LGIATAGLTWFSVIPIAVTDFLRQGAIKWFVKFELGWFFILWVLWIATFADTAANTDCYSLLYLPSNGDKMCWEVHAVEAFSFLAWFLLFPILGSCWTDRPDSTPTSFAMSMIKNDHKN